MSHSSGSLHGRVITGSISLLVSSALTTALNLIYNVYLARLLGPQGYGNVTAVYTILTIVSAITLAIQITCTKMVAKQLTHEGQSAVYRKFHQGAWMCGCITAILLIVLQVEIAQFLNLNSSRLVALLALGALFYVPLGSRRGYILGRCAFTRLSVNLVLEGIARLGGTMLMLKAGLGIEGVIMANSAAVAIAYVVATPRRSIMCTGRIAPAHNIQEILQAATFYTGLVLLNNSDLLLVKHFFTAEYAGLYAAVAMVGRVVFAFSSSVVNAMFPIAAGHDQEEGKGGRLVAMSLLMIFGIGFVIALGIFLMPNRFWIFIFGQSYANTGSINLSGLLFLYAISASVYSLAVLIIAFEMSNKIAYGSWIQLAYSIVMIAFLCMYHSTLQEVIVVQIIIMIALFLSVAIPLLISFAVSAKITLPQNELTQIGLLQQISENEVISEVLQSDFNTHIYSRYHTSMADIVWKPNFLVESDNTIRRRLFLMRHQSLWNEIPVDTRWYKVGITTSNISQIKAFPRANWRVAACGNLSIISIASKMRIDESIGGTWFRKKIDSIREQLGKDQHGFNSVILIGQDVHTPVTVLDGNHRLAAALLTTPVQISKLRFVCGFSPRMTECCWYQSNIVSLSHYAINVLKRFVRSPKSEIAHFLNNNMKRRLNCEVDTRIDSSLGDL